MLSEGLYALLQADDGVSTIVEGRIFSVAVPPDLQQLPAMSYAMVGGAADPTLRTSGVLRQRVELNAFAESYDDADRLRYAIIQALDGWSQRLADHTGILSTALLNPGTDFVGEDRVFRCMAEFYVFYTLPS